MIGSIVGGAVVATWGVAAVLMIVAGRRRFGAVVGAVFAGGAAGVVCGLVDQDALAVAIAAFLPLAVTLVLVASPHGRLAAHGRAAVAAGVALSVIGVVVTAGAGASADAWTIGASTAAALGVALPIAHRNYRRTSALDRRQLQWIGCGAAVAAEAAVVVLALRGFVGWPLRPGLVAAAATIALPAALAASASPRAVAQIDRFLARTVAITGLTGLVVSIYLLVVVGLGRSPDERERGLILLSMVAAAIAAAAYVPARARLETFANRIVYGARVAPQEILRSFGARMTRAIPLDELLLQLAELLKRSLGVAEVEIWTGGDGSYERAVSLPHGDIEHLEIGERERSVIARAGVTGGTWLQVWLPGIVGPRDAACMRVAPLAHAGELLGLIVLVRRADADALSDEQEGIVADLARQVGLALHNVQLDSALQASLEELRERAEELQESRLRLVTAGDAERRRLERDLHDGAQQQLVAIAVKVNLARTLLESDASSAAQLLDDVKGDLTDAVQELRNLAHGIYPPLLMSGGLPSALPAAATRSVLPVDVQLDGIDRYDQSVEATVYYCCLEAMQNAGKHAGEGSSLRLRVWRDDDGGLCFEVADDGAGFSMGNGEVRGHGFVNMQDRLGALGGSLDVWSAPGEGARVGGRIPLAAT